MPVCCGIYKEVINVRVQRRKKTELELECLLALTETSWVKESSAVSRHGVLCLSGCVQELLKGL